MKTASAFKSKYSNFRQIFSQLVCLILAVVFFTFTTSSIFAQPKNQVQKSDPFTLTPEKQGMFQGLPEKFKGLFNSDSQLLNGFFQFIERNLGGASAQQTPPTIPTYSPYQFPMPVSADFIKVTSSRRADCTQDVPPDELLPATCDDTADSQCPWTAAQPPPCPRQPGVGCCTGNSTCACTEVCLPGGNQVGIIVTNHCSGTIGDVHIVANTSTGPRDCGPHGTNVPAGATRTFCLEYGIFYDARLVSSKVSNACQIDDPTKCCGPGVEEKCDVQ